MQGRYHALAKERTMLLRCESLEPPMSQLGHSRRSGDVRVSSAHSPESGREADIVDVTEVQWIGIGGSLAAPPLPHHRTYGSVYGGSRS